MLEEALLVAKLPPRLVGEDGVHDKGAHRGGARRLERARALDQRAARPREIVDDDAVAARRLALLDCDDARVAVAHLEQRTASYSASRGAKRFAPPSSGYTTTGAGPPGRAASSASFSCSSGTADLSCTCTLSEK